MAWLVRYKKVKYPTVDLKRMKEQNKGVKMSASPRWIEELALTCGTPSRFIEPIRMADLTPHRVGNLA